VSLVNNFTLYIFVDFRVEWDHLFLVHLVDFSAFIKEENMRSDFRYFLLFL